MVSHKIQVWHTLEGTSRTVSTAHKGTSTLAERVRTEKNVGDTLKKIIITGNRYGQGRCLEARNIDTSLYF